MRPVLRIAAVLLAAATFFWWSGKGRNTGWTKDRVAVEKVDEITEITYTEYEDRFVPGVEYLAAGGAAAVLLIGLSFLRRKRPDPS